MKFLLVAINAKYIHSNPAVYSLRAYAGEQNREHIAIAEYTINQRTEEILAEIYARKPDVIGFSCYIWNWKIVQELLEEIPKLLPGVPIWLGGPEVTYDADKILTGYPQLQGIMVGEGEETFRELLEAYVAEKQAPGKYDIPKEHLMQIPGLCLPGGYTVSRRLTDLCALPFLYEELESFENRIIYYESSRGCPFRCSYCLSSIDKKVRFREIDMVEKELQFFLDRKVAQVKFIDRTFNCDHGHAMAIWNYIHEHDNGVTNFHFEIAAELLREDEMALLNSLRPGQVQLEIGVQTTNPQTLRAVHRASDPEELMGKVERIRSGNNIHCHLDLIAGLPYENYESFGQSFDAVYRMRPEQLQLGFLKVLKGSEMWERAQEYGLSYLATPPYEVLYTRWLSYDDVLRLKRIEEVVELYYNSNQFVNTLRFLENAFARPFQMYEELAIFYAKGGYFTNSPSRAYRYRVLLEFALQRDPERESIYRELLTYDMYLRENCKSRADFMTDLSHEDYREFSRCFYRWEEENRHFLTGYEAYDHRQLAKMTHLEPFRYPVWDPNKLQGFVKATPEETCRGYVLFDYSRRNPLNADAVTHVIDEEFV